MLQENLLFKKFFNSIRNCLDSHDQVEVEAAIFATKAFCKQSRYLVILIFIIDQHIDYQ